MTKCARGLLLLAVVVAFAGCALPVAPFRTLPTSEFGCDPRESECGGSFIEETTEYLLGFVEFDDLGWAHDRRQQDEILRRIEEVTAEGDVLMLLFAHGWKHNASACDSNVTCFREILEQLYETEQRLAAGGEPRRIVGIYVGWRGTSWNNRLLKQLSFYGRKGTAHKVGSGAVTELLVRLKQLRELRHRKVRDEEGRMSSTRLVIVGHSFGGALVWSATSQLIMERLAVAAASEDRSVRGFGDLVLLVNPAFEAARFYPMFETLEASEFVAAQNPVFVIATSTGDGATGSWFPRGRAISIRLDDYPSGTPQRSERGRLERDANLRAVGHFDAVTTHSLTAKFENLEPGKQDPDRRERCLCPFALTMEGGDDGRVMQRVDDFRNHDWSAEPAFAFPSSVLTWDSAQLPSNSPVMVIEVDPRIIPNHVDIYQPTFVDFLRHLILASGEQAAYGTAAPTD